MAEEERPLLTEIGSVGEPINPKYAILYHKKVIGARSGLDPRRHMVAETETGGILITPLPGAWFTKPG